MPLLPGDVPSRQGIQDAIDEVYNDLDNRINQMDSGWVALTLGTGWTGSAQYRVINNVVYLRGRVTRTSGSDTTILTLPAAVRPSATLSCLMRAGAPASPAINAGISTNGGVVVSGAYSTGTAAELESLPPFPLG